MIYLLIWLFDIYGDVIVSMFITGIGLTGLSLAIFAFAVDRPEKFKKVEKLIKRTGFTGVLLIFVGVLVPSKQGVALMGGVYVGSQIYDKINQSVLIDKSVKILELELNNYLDKLIDEKTENSKKIEKSKESKDYKE